MKVRHDEGVANHIGPEPCGGNREGSVEASVGERIGQPLSRESLKVSGADVVGLTEGNMDGRVIASARPTRRGQRNWHVRKLVAREPGGLGFGLRRDAGCAHCRDQQPEGELHTRRRYPVVLHGGFPVLVIRFLKHRVGDTRILRLVQKWLRAGVLEDGIVTIEEKGTGQGSVISPLLANVYLHYVFDLWAERWRRREATGDMIMVRYADDIVVGFQHEGDARRFWDAMRDRLREFSLSLHPDKTRLIEFGRFAAQNCKKRGLAKPETFTFLGFVLICDKSRRGDFRVRRKSRGDRMKTKLREIKEALRQRTNRPIPETGKWLAQVVAGYFAYHAVPTNGLALSAFRYHVKHLWHRQLCRRSQRARLLWTQMTKLVDEFLPKPLIHHPWPSVRFAVKHPR